MSLNAVSVTDLDDAYPNFHALWDGSLEGSWNAGGTTFVIPKEPRPFTFTATTPELTAMVQKVTVADPIDPSMEEGNYVTWAKSTHELGIQAYNALDQDYQSNKVTVSADYVAEVQTVSERQIVLAGVRLAAVLNRLYP